MIKAAFVIKEITTEIRSLHLQEDILYVDGHAIASQTSILPYTNVPIIYIYNNYGRTYLGSRQYGCSFYSGSHTCIQPLEALGLDNLFECRKCTLVSGHFSIKELALGLHPDFDQICRRRNGAPDGPCWGDVSSSISWVVQRHCSYIVGVFVVGFFFVNSRTTKQYYRAPKSTIYLWQNFKEAYTLTKDI